MLERFSLLFLCFVYTCVLAAHSKDVLFELVNTSCEGSHNDFSAQLHVNHFQEAATYIDWKKKPRGVKAKPSIGQNAYVISLTTWPPRTKKGTQGIWLTIESLMRQSVKPDRIILWLSLKEYPDGLANVPQTLIDLQNRGLEIIFVPENEGAAKKLLPALRAQLKANIITVDDDIIYPKDWLKAFIASHRAHPHAVHAIARCELKVMNGVLQPYNRGNDRCTDKGANSNDLGKVTDLPLGCLGILYPYDASGRTYHGLDKRVLETCHLRFSFKTDDLWFYVCRLLAGTPLRLFGQGGPMKGYAAFCELSQPLWWFNVVQEQNDVILKQLLEALPKLGQLLDLDLSKPQCIDLNPVPSSGSYWRRLRYKVRLYCKKWVAKFAIV